MSSLHFYKQRISMLSYHSTSDLRHVNLPLVTLVILAVFHPAISMPSTTPALTYPIPPVPSQSSAFGSKPTVDIIDNLRSLRSVVVSCWSGTIRSIKNDRNNSNISTDRSFKSSWSKEAIEELKECLRDGALQLFDRVLNRDVIDVVPGGWIKLVRSSRDGKDNYREGKRSTSNGRQIFDWRFAIIRRLLRLLRNHHLEINLNPHHDHDMEGRRRHHFMPMLVFGAITSSIIAIPMMFQFLSVLGGKALLLAKLALILTAIQGLKKVATSNFNYGQQYDRQYFFDMNMDYTPPGAAGLANPYAEHLDRINNIGGTASPQIDSIPERNYIPDYQQVLRPRSTIITNVDE